MDPLTDTEVAVIIERLEAVVTELEHAVSARTLYTFVLTAQAFAETKHSLSALAHIHRCLTLAHRMLAIRDRLCASGRWTPLTDVLEVIHSDATRLTTLYGMARPSYRMHRRALQQAFHAAFTQATGTTYHAYGQPKTTKERTTITAFWDEALHTALARFQTEGTADTLDAVMAGLPAWADRRHERWNTQGWREPSVQEVMQLVTDYLRVCEACLGTLAEIAGAAVAQAPVVERAQVTHDVAQAYAAQAQGLRDQIRTLVIPTNAPKAQQTQLRREKTQLQQALQALQSAQEAAITRQLKQGTTARHKLEMLVKTVHDSPATVRRKVGKMCVDVLPRVLWISGYERQRRRRLAQREARRPALCPRGAAGPRPAGGRGGSVKVLQSC